MFKKKIFVGAVFAALLMLSLAFIQPVSARESGMLDVVNAIEHIENIVDDENIQQYIDQILTDEELIMLLEAILSAISKDTHDEVDSHNGPDTIERAPADSTRPEEEEDSSASLTAPVSNEELNGLAEQFNTALESNPAYIALTSYIYNTYGPDLAVIQAFSKEATQDDMQNVINSVVSPDGTAIGDITPAGFTSNSEEYDASCFSASEGEETTYPYMNPIDPTDDIIIVDDLYPVYAPWLGFDPLDPDGDGIYESGVQTIYAEGYEGPVINIVGADVVFWDSNGDPVFVPSSFLDTLMDIFGDNDIDWYLNLIGQFLLGVIQALYGAIAIWSVAFENPEDFAWNPDGFVLIQALIAAGIICVECLWAAGDELGSAIYWTKQLLKNYSIIEILRALLG